MRGAASAAGAALLAFAAMPGGAQPAEAGARAFQKCFACHSVTPGETGLPGPNLAGVVGRRAGALAGFDYSPAMAAAGAKGLRWDRATLGRFLAEPEAVVPGTAMEPPFLASEAERRAVLDYLAARR